MADSRLAEWRGKADDFTHEALWHLFPREVSALLENDQPRAIDHRVEPPACFERDQLIVRAPDDQCSVNVW